MDGLPNDLKRLVYALLVIIFVFYMQSKLPPLMADWFALVVFSLSFLSGDPSIRIQKILITGLAATGFVYGMPPPAILFLLAIGGCYLYQKFPDTRLSVLIVVMLTIWSSHFPLSPVMNAERCLMMIAGIAILLPPQLLFFSRASAEADQRLVLKELKVLNAIIFSCLLDPEYRDNLYLYERRFHVQKQRCRELFLKRETTQQLDSLFNNMMDYAQLRRRVADYTTLSVCSQELRAILLALDHLLDKVRQYASPQEVVEQHRLLDRRIRDLEDNYYHVLQVAAREPMIFLLFINSLQALGNRLLAMGTTRGKQHEPE